MAGATTAGEEAQRNGGGAGAAVPAIVLAAGGGHGVAGLVLRCVLCIGFSSLQFLE